MKHTKRTLVGILSRTERTLSGGLLNHRNEHPLQAEPRRLCRSEDGDDDGGGGFGYMVVAFGGGGNGGDGAWWWGSGRSGGGEAFETWSENSPEKWRPAAATVAEGWPDPAVAAEKEREGESVYVCVFC
ncbi:hypothetical protein Tco_1501673 [Tanacetum coccineum]